MWAVSPIPSSPSWPPSTTTTKQPSAYRPAPVTVSAKPRRQSRTGNKDLNYYDGDDDNEVDSSAQASAKSEANSNASWELKSQEPDSFGGLGRSLFTAANNSVNPKEEKQISGSDVLWALQKAAAARKPKAKKKEVRSDSQVSKGNGGNRKKRMEEENSVDYSNVKPLDIRGDWGTRLDALEKRLHELTDI